MKRKKGYLLLENVISIATILILLSILYYLLFFSCNTTIKLQDKVELQQQANEISKYIEDIIGNSKEIIGITLDNKGEEVDDFISVTSIKCRYRSSNTDSSIKDKEISLKKNLDKLFINTLRNNGTSESGGYEIGDYIDSMYISKNSNGKLIDIRLELSKNNEKLVTDFSVNIKNYEGGSV